MKRVAIVYNPIKITDLDDRVALAAQLAPKHGYEKPDWIPTTEDDPGYSMGAEAIENGVDLVIAMGGDGTVRKVAEAVQGTGTAFGIIPEGTGNLLARNLDLPIASFETGLVVALTGTDRMIDVGFVQFDNQDEEAFLVIAGAGMDADTMANTNDNLKKLMGWMAYVEGGARALLARGFRVSIDNDQPGPDDRPHHARSYMVCNCGILTAGIVLVPEAEPDDGQLDTMVLSPRGPMGWAAVFTQVLTRHRRGHARMRHWTTREATATFHREVEAQIDGDAVGGVRRMRTRVAAGALPVRVAPTT